MAALLRLPEVRQRTGLSSNSVYRLASAGDFPAPIKIGPRASAWVEEEIDAWIKRRILASRGSASASTLKQEAKAGWLS